MGCYATAIRIQINAHIRLIGLIAILVSHGLLLGWISVINAPMYDEMAHLPSGLAHWQLGNFDLYRVNPPLMRMIASIPLLLIEPETDWTWFTDGAYDRPEFQIGRRFLQVNGYNSFWYFTVCRWAQIPVSIFGGWICYCWARDLFGKSSGFIALLLWCMCPNVLAWGATITPDLGAAAFGVAAVYTFWCWLKRPNWKSALIAGFVLGLAELSKSTWIVLFPLFPTLWVSWRYCVRALDAAKPPPLQLAIILLIALYLLNFGYGFEHSCQRVDQFTFISRTLGGENAHVLPGNRLRDTWFAGIPVPLPANYLKGIDVQKYDFEKEKWSYLRGEQKLGGWYHYYVYALVVKTPLGAIIVFGFAIILMLLQGKYSSAFRNEVTLLLPAIVVLGLVSSQTGFNRYLRYILPAAPFLYIFASRAGKVFEEKPRLPKALCAACVVAFLLGSLSIFPHSMSYFNLAAGGPLSGPKHLLDANVDWGQDLLQLKRFVKGRPHIAPVHFAYFGCADPKVAGFSFESLQVPENGEGVSNLKSGWYAISVNHVFGYRHYENDKPTLVRFQRFAPNAMAGYSIYLYHVTPEMLADLNRPTKPKGSTWESPKQQ